MPERESKDERLDRELIELLNELRVALPGVQVLFAFLLAVPFSQRFERLTAAQEDVFFAAFLCTAVATALLIAPSSYHRLRWRERDKEQILRTSNRLAIAGTAFLAAAVVAVVYLVTDLIFGRAATILATALSAIMFGWFWYGLPLVRRWRAPARS
jgi:predicted membrane channel-forming protein YqfA (hemolysin III family)